MMVTRLEFIRRRMPHRLSGKKQELIMLVNAVVPSHHKRKHPSILREEPRRSSSQHHPRTTYPSMSWELTTPSTSKIKLLSPTLHAPLTV